LTVEDLSDQDQGKGFKYSHGVRRRLKDGERIQGSRKVGEIRGLGRQGIEFGDIGRAEIEGCEFWVADTAGLGYTSLL